MSNQKKNPTGQRVDFFVEKFSKKIREKMRRNCACSERARPSVRRDSTLSQNKKFPTFGARVRNRNESVSFPTLIGPARASLQFFFLLDENAIVQGLADFQNARTCLENLAIFGNYSTNQGAEMVH
jgi:hypothetical protein